jgi:hypothetical protein
MDTITITTINGPETVKARPTPCPGLVITGKRGAWTITHAKSGKRVCDAPIGTLDDIRNAMMGATMADMLAAKMFNQGPVDWTLAEAELAKREDDCQGWIRAFWGILAHSRPAAWCHTTDDITRNWER